MLLDGGLATELEARGHDLAHPLWSARLLLTAPDEIGAVHRSFLAAGAGCITAATYQASLPGLTKEGLSPAQARTVLLEAVAIARRARDEHRDGGASAPLVAAARPASTDVMPQILTLTRMARPFEKRGSLPDRRRSVMERRCAGRRAPARFGRKQFALGAADDPSLAASGRRRPPA